MILVFLCCDSRGLVSVLVVVVVGAGWCFYGGCRRLSGEVNCGHLQDGDRSSGRGLVEVVLVV